MPDNDRRLVLVNEKGQRIYNGMVNIVDLLQEGSDAVIREGRAWAYLKRNGVWQPCEIDTFWYMAKEELGCNTRLREMPLYWRQDKREPNTVDNDEEAGILRAYPLKAAGSK